MSGFERLRDVLVGHGHRFETLPGDAQAWHDVAAELRLPSDLWSMYETSGPARHSVIPWVVEDAFVYSLEELSDAQDGYRWTGADRVPLSSWPTAWVVIASVSGDPFFIDTATPGCPVQFARHGAGAWAAVDVASTLGAFVEALAVFESVLLGVFDSEVWTDDGLLAEFLREVEAGLGAVLTPAQAATFSDLLE